jgi:hypothetical protein
MFLNNENVPDKNAKPAIHPATAWIPGIIAGVGIAPKMRYVSGKLSAHS